MTGIFASRKMNITYFYVKLPRNFYNRNFTTQNLTKKITSSGKNAVIFW